MGWGVRMRKPTMVGVIASRLPASEKNAEDAIERGVDCLLDVEVELVHGVWGSKQKKGRIRACLRVPAVDAPTKCDLEAGTLQVVEGG
jgi:hypothetical protein